MRRFWNEIQEHRLASVLFLAYWALAYVLHVSRWHAPKHTGDIVPPVLLLHALLPFVAGLLAAWWRGRHPGRILDGMLAGAVVTLADFVLIFLHDALKSSGGNSQGGDGIMEIPAWLAVVSLIGAVLGCVGAAGGAAFGGKIPLAERRRTAALPRRILLTASALAFSVAVAILVAVIPPVAADTSPRRYAGSSGTRLRNHGCSQCLRWRCVYHREIAKNWPGKSTDCRWNRTACDCLGRGPGRRRVCCRWTSPHGTRGRRAYCLCPRECCSRNSGVGRHIPEDRNGGIALRSRHS